MASHPQFVEIPGMEAEGVYRYNEPETPHPLQVAFRDPAQQAAYENGLKELLVAGRFDDAAALIAHDLEGFAGRTARIAKAASADQVAIEGWEDLSDIIEEFEGPDVTCITAGLSNAPDLVFGKGQEYEPELLFNLYSDDEYRFGDRSDDELLAACGEDMPGWIGHEEDIEFYCTVAGLAPLNSALIQCRHRIYDRGDPNGPTDRAPGGYVEYKLACWWRTTIFLQAVARAIEAHGLPEGARLIVGAFGMDADLAAILGERKQVAPQPYETKAPAMAALTITNWERGNLEEEEEQVSTGTSVRQRIAAPPPPEEPKEKPGSAGFFNRLFGR